IDGEPPALGQVPHALDGESMGTTWSVRFIGPDGLRLAAIEAAIVRACDEVIAQMSGWDAASDLSRFNRAPAGTVCPLPDDFATVLDAALKIAAASGGAYDPSAGALVALWGFGPSGETRSRHAMTIPPSAPRRRRIAPASTAAGTRCRGTARVAR
ncbi:FAD:protein FMN transferase, partial [Mitsuaria sp. TWR114]|uniref:FAD:protein FMN transferase n=1 Tax=Mitsuaria sp. TWR114 TaxID=2601731 RepID=UPI002102ED8F